MRAFDRRSVGVLALVPLILGLIPPAPVAAAVGYSLQVSDMSVAVGDTLTITPMATGAEPGKVVRCTMIIGRELSVDDWMRMKVSSNGCEPWSFTVPATAPGLLLVQGYVHVMAPDGVVESVVWATNQDVTVLPGGTPEPFVTNYPVQSWALPDIVSDPTPTHGAALTIKPPSSAASCNMRIVADFEESAVHLVDTCEPWTLSIPERDRQGPTDLFEERTEVTVRSWIGEWGHDDHFPEHGLVGTMFGETFTANLPHFQEASGATSGYTSNLPAVFIGPQRGYVGQVGAEEPLLLEPVVAGTTTGLCSFAGLGVFPVVPGGCEEPYPVGPVHGASHGMASAWVDLIDEDVNHLSDAFLDVGWVLDMSELVLEIPATADSGESVSIDASNDEGVPAAYDVIATLGAPGGALQPQATTTIASGLFNPSMSAHGEDLHLTHAFTPGTWTVTATFTDVRGETRADSSVIEVSDVTAPVGTVSVNNAGAWSKSTTVSVAVPAADVGGTVTTVALSNDGVSWTNRPYATPQAWTLPPTNGPSRIVYARWQDAAGNWSPVANDTIGLDTVLPSATAPKQVYLAGATVNGGAIPVQFTWTGSDATSGVARYEAAISTDGGAFATISTSLTSASLTRSLAAGHSYRLRVRPADQAGNVGAWVVGPAFTVTRYQDGSSSIVRRGTWKLASSSAYWGGGERFSKTAGDLAKITFSGRSFAWIGSTGPSRGTARVYVNGVLVTTVNLHATSVSNRRVLLSLDWATAGSRTVKIKVVGTAGHPRVNIDAIVTGT